MTNMADISMLLLKEVKVLLSIKTGLWQPTSYIIPYLL